MKRRGFRRARTSGRSYFKRRSRRSGSRSGGNAKLFQPTAMAYGAVRGLAAGYIAPQVARILPANLQQYSDELGMGFASWAAAKYGSGMIRDIGNKGLTVENARVGETLAAGLLPQVGVSTSSTYTYG